MNCSVYVFGELSAGYTQYPEDSSSDVLKTLYNHCKAPTQIVVHRDSSLMYFCYIRKLNNNKYIGLGVAVNGYYLSRINVLFSLFEETIERMARQGVLIHFSEDGSLTTSLEDLKKEEEELESLIHNLRIGFENLRKYATPLPETDYTIAKDSIKEHCMSDGIQEVIRSSYSYGFTYIYKDKDYDTVRMNSYKGVLKRLNEENETLKKTNNELQEKNKTILRQKKQYRYVMILALLILGCGVGLVFLNGNLKDTQTKLEQARQTISDKKKSIDVLNNNIQSLKSSLNSEKEKREKAENDFASFKTLLSDRQPFIVKSTSFNFSSGQFSFNYYGLKEETVNIQVKAFSGKEYYSNSTSMSVTEGNNSFSLYLSDNLSSSTWYSFEILIDNKIIGGDRH